MCRHRRAFALGFARERGLTKSQRAAQLAERLCATCHMAPGQGEKKSRAEIPGFYAIARRPNQNEEGIIAWLRTVPPMMPNHHLSQDEMVSLAQFIMSLRDGQQP